MSDLLFLVVGRSKTEKITKEGNRETTFKVTLQTEDKKHKLTLMDADPVLLVKYPLQSNVPVNIGKSDQSNLVTEGQLKAEIEKAEETSKEEKTR